MAPATPSPVVEVEATTRTPSEFNATPRPAAPENLPGTTPASDSSSGGRFSYFVLPAVQRGHTGYFATPELVYVTIIPY